MEANLEHKTTYMQMIKGNIDRMSTTSALFKGFSATIVTGIAVISYIDINKWILLLATVPILLFLGFDVYYLQLEKRFRKLYNDVREDKHQVDFDLAPPQIDGVRNKVEKFIRCIESPSVYMFYGPLIIVLGIIVYMKFRGVI